jgi:hypothetical protein
MMKARKYLSRRQGKYPRKITITSKKRIITHSKKTTPALAWISEKSRKMTLNAATPTRFHTDTDNPIFL